MELKDKVPPHNLEAEKATLGAILLDWGSIGDVVTYLRGDNFYSQQNQIIFESLTGLFAKGIRGDMLTLIDDLTKTGNLEKAGGMAYVSSLTDTVPTSSNVDYYAKIVLDNSTRRNLIKISSDIKILTPFLDNFGASVLQLSNFKGSAPLGNDCLRFQF